MNRDFSQQILDLDRMPIRIGETIESIKKAFNSIYNDLSDDLKKRFDAAMKEEAGKPLTMSSVCSTALVAPLRDDEGKKDLLEDHVRRMKLAEKIHNGDVLDITSDDIVLIKERVTKTYNGAIIPARIAMFLEQSE